MSKDNRRLKEIEEMYKSILPFLTKEAIDRLSNIKAVYPEKFIQVILILYQYIQTGKIKKIDDELLKNILSKLSEKREPKIKFIH
ncbi:MAG: DNA-binding protein [Candidatus Nanopusillus sp.]|jgi:DNA-binding TFAR19-related protein (PDSD5 family)|nr:DNA-binding protein [Candidatus Nanopusillus sp.]